MSILSSARARAGLFGLGLAMTVSPAALAAVIEGTVEINIDEETARGVALEGAEVRIQETGQNTVTARDGSFRFAGIPEGAYTLEVSYFGAEPTILTVTTSEADPASVTVRMAEEGVRLGAVIVSGQRGAYFSARQQERASDSLISVLSSDAVGSLPDQNVAESVRRVAGLSIQNDQGEGRFVTIRGLDPALNATSVNGVRLPSPEGDTRAVALDVIDSDALDSIVIKKSLTPDMDGDGIGGTIDIKTLSAFDRDGRYLRLKAEGIYSEITDAMGEKGSVTASDVFMDGALGVAGSLTWNRRDFGSDNVEVDGGWLREGVAAYPGEYELRDYVVTRQRLSGTLNFDYRLGASTDLYLRTLYNEFEDQEYRSRVEVKLEDAGFGDFSAENGVVAFTEGDEIEIDRDIKDRLETQQIWSIQAGGETAIDVFTIDYSLAYSHAEEAEENRLDTAFRANDPGDFSDNVRIGLDVSNTERPQIVPLDADTFNYFYNPDSYEFDEAENLDGITEDDEFAAALNVRRDGNVFGLPGFVKGGVKARLREKTRDVESTIYDGFDGPDYLLTQVGRFADFPLDLQGPVPSAFDVRDIFNANRDLFEVNDADTALASNGADYEAEENVYAAYLMGQIDNGQGFTVTAGGRLEVTDLAATGRIVAETDGSVEVPDAVFLADGDVAVARNFERNSYTDFLPSVNIKADTGSVVFRAAYYESIARPNIEQFVPSASLEIDEGDVEGEVGNPDLDRQRARNIDLSVDWYMDNNGVLSAGVFYKDIEDFIAAQAFQDATFFGITYDEAVQAQNLDNSEVSGIELSYQNVLDGLPAPFDGFLIGANYTRAFGSAKVDGREIDLPRLSDEIANVILGYDKFGLDLRAALSYRSEYLDEINTGGFGIDRIVDEHTQIDLTAKYSVTDRFQITAELQNVTDEPFRAFLNDGGDKLLSQYEEYGYTARFGVRFTY